MLQYSRKGRWVEDHTMSFTDEIFKIKTPFDALMFLCKLESKLQYALACTPGRSALLLRQSPWLV